MLSFPGHGAPRWWLVSSSAREDTRRQAGGAGEGWASAFSPPGLPPTANFMGTSCFERCARRVCSSRAHTVFLPGVGGVQVAVRAISGTGRRAPSNARPSPNGPTGERKPALSPGEEKKPLGCGRARP